MSNTTTRELAAAARTMPRSGIREIMDLAWSLPEAIHLEVGEPNFPTAPHVLEAASRSAAGGATRYTPNAGIAELREALAEKVRTRNGIDASAERIVVTNGAVEALYSSLLALLDPGDAILLPDPGWPNFRMMAGLLHAEVLAYPLTGEHGYQPDISTLERLITPRTKVLLVNTPSNPLGTVLGVERARALLELARQHDLWVVSDECYDELVYDGPSAHLGELDEDGRVISVFSFSKTYAMTGWRVGYAVVPEVLADTMAKLQEPLISCVNAPAQYAALAAVTGPQDVVDEMRGSYRRRRDAAKRALEAAEVAVHQPDGAFYLWVVVAAAGLTSREFARELVTRHEVAVVPGTAFGDAGEGAVRISLATDEKPLLEGTRRLIDLHTELRAR